VTWERFGAASGFAFVAFLIASFVVVPDSPPALDDPIVKIKEFYVDHASGFQASAYLIGVASFFFLWFLGTLGNALGRVDAGRATRLVVFPAGALALAFALLPAVVNDVLATRLAAEADQNLIRALYDMQAIAAAFVAFPLAALVGATSVVAHRATLLPPLVTLLGFALVPGWLVSGFAVFIETGTFSPTGAYGLIVLLFWIAWVLAVSASLLRAAGAPAIADAR